MALVTKHQDSVDPSPIQQRTFPFSRDLPNDLLGGWNRPSAILPVPTSPSTVYAYLRQSGTSPTSLVSENESFPRRHQSQSSTLQNALTPTASARRTVPQNYLRHFSGPDGALETRPERRGWSSGEKLRMRDVRIAS